MMLILSWLAFSIFVGVAAHYRDRSGVAWTFLAMLISPLAAGILLFILPRLQPSEQSRNRQCLFCAEIIKREAVFCRHCQHSLPELPALPQPSRDLSKVPGYITVGVVVFIIAAAVLSKMV